MCSIPDSLMIAYMSCHLLGMSCTVTNPALYGYINNNLHQEIMMTVREIQDTVNTRIQVNSPSYWYFYIISFFLFQSFKIEIFKFCKFIISTILYTYIYIIHFFRWDLVIVIWSQQKRLDFDLRTPSFESCKGRLFCDVLSQRVLSVFC